MEQILGNSDISDWIGSKNTSRGIVEIVTAELINSTIGKKPNEDFKNGDPLPPLWHWFAFPSATHLSQLGDDGHPKHVGYTPPKDLTRRMWASGSLTFHSVLRVGQEITKDTTVLDIKEKESQSGKMVFITYEHKLRNSSNIAITETQNIVYLQASQSFNPPKKRDVPQPDYPKDKIVISNPLLFRFSALTYNAHRIHYDLKYAQEVEKYPHLIVHGPLQALFLMQYASELRNSSPKKFSFRGVHPAFANNSMELVAKTSNEDLTLYTASNGHQCMEATASWKKNYE